MQLFQLHHVTPPLFISGFYSAELYRDSVPLCSNDNDKTHFLSFPVESTLLPPSNFCFEHCAIIIIPRASFSRPGIDGIINKHHANYSATVLLIFSPHLRGNTPAVTDVTINHSTQVCFRAFISASAPLLGDNTRLFRKQPTHPYAM